MSKNNISSRTEDFFHSFILPVEFLALGWVWC